MATDVVAVVPYDSAWPRRFELERTLLEQALHPGWKAASTTSASTAVRGLAAKPIIDIMAAVRDLDEAGKAFQALRALSYVYTPHRPSIANHSRSPPLGLMRSRTACI